MTARERRSEITRLLANSREALSAAVLASELGVSRQVIVGDVALLRAAGEKISATPRGYLLERESGMIVRTVVCSHTRKDTQLELDIMVDNGCVVQDVIVEHPIYGQLTGSLELRSRYDVRQFIQRLTQEDALPLSALTDGMHLHTLLCPDEESFERVLSELRQAGILFHQKA